MTLQNSINYNRIAEAIRYIKENFKQQPDLDEIASKVHLSPFHFQRLFTEWVGVSPKKFLQFISIEYAKQVLKNNASTLFDTAFETGLSGTGRLHDMFINIEGMTPGEYKNEGQNLEVNYNFYDTNFGTILVGSTSKGICHMAFTEDRDEGFVVLQKRFCRAQFNQTTDPIQENALHIFTKDWKQQDQIKLHLKATDFQIKVWSTLLKIPKGGLATYSDVANHIDNPGAVRAVGTAIGQNPVAFLIPCHRVIRASGDFGQYHWGTVRKTAIIGWEAANV
ncbi:bifunctional helix-turn-helix domain-containing protein/methylated-DNA--[protein]-cysteine S-methyltransferase [Aquimarina spongiae]|uniref:methylated-DNA--[protein]-cysteine S-methyltransferase n=1 Tax=Aquimarina spongiae TaxID=570521 RepID=A0A1M6D406_9FLAO|nr:methylated-DNA--[protein]-cysteine S-methyltransferase [Aquimarina spongiae]SHI67990.1 AraC family transcriptional regulator, regulatory protein of adaptative response / methylated-DNA-[protein]-cysteine methyltransferase [Aquimarina spongiae]